MVPTLNPFQNCFPLGSNFKSGTTCLLKFPELAKSLNKSFNNISSDPIGAAPIPRHFSRTKQFIFFSPCLPCQQQLMA